MMRQLLRMQTENDSLLWHFRNDLGSNDRAKYGCMQMILSSTEDVRFTASSTFTFCFYMTTFTSNENRVVISSMYLATRATRVSRNPLLIFIFRSFAHCTRIHSHFVWIFIIITAETPWSLYWPTLMKAQNRYNIARAASVADSDSSTALQLRLLTHWHFSSFRKRFNVAAFAAFACGMAMIVYMCRVSCSCERSAYAVRRLV